MCEQNDEKTPIDNIKEYLYRKKISLVLSGLAFCLSIFATVCGLGGVRVEITHETYIGTIVTLLGIMITLLIGYQIFNYLFFENKIKSIVENRLTLIKKQMLFDKKEIRVKIFLDLLRGSLLDSDWEKSFDYMIFAMDDIKNIEDVESGTMLVNLLHQCSLNNTINYTCINKSTIGNLLNSLCGLYSILDINNIEKLRFVISELEKNK